MDLKLLRLFPRLGQFYFQNSLLYHVTVYNVAHKYGMMNKYPAVEICNFLILLLCYYPNPKTNTTLSFQL